MNFKNLVDPTETISISAGVSQGVGGIWVGSRDGGHPDFASIQYEAKLGPCLMLWGHGDGIPLAITHDGVQLPSIKDGGYRFIDWEVLYDLVQRLGVPKPA